MVKIMVKEIIMHIIKVILTSAKYYGIVFGGYVFIGALYLRCSICSTEDDTWGKCIKKSLINTIKMKPWYTKIDD